jgi:phosphoribosylformylglycinamidine synthase
LNFASPQVPETMWRFARAVEGIADACNALGVPVVSGNVSLYNETAGQPILPTPSVAIVGQLESVEDRLGLAFRAAGDVIAHLGAPSRGLLGGSEWRTQKTGAVGGAPVGIDLDAEARLQRAVLSMARAHVLASAHDVSDGGFGVTLAESAIQSGLGASVTLPGAAALAPAARLFSEEPSRVVVSFGRDRLDAVRRIAAEHDVPFTLLGEVGGTRLAIDGVLDVAVDVLADAHHRCLEPIVGI